MLWVAFLPDPGYRAFPKNSKKNHEIFFKKKTKNRNSGFISSQTESGQAEKMNKKIRFGYCFYPTQARTFPKKFKKNSKKIQKNPKNVILAPFLAKTG